MSNLISASVQRRLVGSATRKSVLGYMADDATVREEYEGKVVFNDSVPEIREALDNINAVGLPAILEAAQKRGATDAEGIAKAYLDNLERWQKISQERIKGDADMLAEALWDEIYSKLEL